VIRPSETGSTQNNIALWSRRMAARCECASCRAGARNGKPLGLMVVTDKDTGLFSRDYVWDAPGGAEHRRRRNQITSHPNKSMRDFICSSREPPIGGFSEPLPFLLRGAAGFDR